MREKERKNERHRQPQTGDSSGKTARTAAGGRLVDAERSFDHVVLADLGEAPIRGDLARKKARELRHGRLEDLLLLCGAEANHEAVDFLQHLPTLIRDIMHDLQGNSW